LPFFFNLSILETYIPLIIKKKPPCTGLSDEHARDYFIRIYPVYPVESFFLFNMGEMPVPPAP